MFIAIVMADRNIISFIVKCMIYDMVTELDRITLLVFPSSFHQQVPPCQQTSSTPSSV